ncbi:hypothetical protein MNBD_GAMMA13-1702 [hydrothermal vent metagenome]|uniref:Porin domain-containing protein n=1 Tax=hydrothermal vent metagenome TaxID=652676 RepID=A0A3B0Y5S5_9ZZZZ
MSKRLYEVAVATCLMLSVNGLQAMESIKFNGFMTAGATGSDSSVDSQNGKIGDDIGFDQDTRVGIQVSAEINHRMSVTAQILGSNREQDNFDATFDWGYLNYSLTEDADIRGGKIKFPTFLASDYIEVGYAYPWIRPPAEVYSSIPITSILGVDALYRTDLGPTDLLIQPYFGTANDQDALVPQEVLPLLGKPVGSVEYENFDSKNLIGINVALSNAYGTLRAGYLQAEISAGAFGVNDEDATFWSVGATVDWNNIIGYSEYFERDVDGAAGRFFPNQNGWYTTVGYRVDRFLPHITYAQLRGDNSNGNNTAKGVGLEQDSITAGLRYELGMGADLKVEYQRVDLKSGSRGLFIENTGDVNIFSLAVDVIF